MDAGPAQRDVACFVVVAEYLSFSRAAERLGMTQPAASQAVARLERALGVRLFERTSREVRLSDEGKVLLPYAEAMLAHAAAFTAEAARLAEPGAGPIRLAYCPLVGALAARVARRLAARSPSVDVELRRAGWNAATQELSEGGSAAALMTMPFPRGTATTARFHIPVTHVAVPARDPLATAARVTFDQLAGRDVLLPRARPPGSVWHALAGRLPAHFVPADLDDLPAALDLVAAGRGALAAPQLLAETVRRPDVRFIPLAASDLRMTYGLVWLPDRATADLMTLIQTVRHLLRTP
ncbi:LysR family transcriptional regulator [Phytohabitans aurantiacus]|uniref:LysR family transcriptional regulator n=1 Tax=Phytohabitans aurantiacus TaxID=3016789 RepID=UPI002492BC0D|nr:LysR family transcriptional regulator [Phytohabitans aurantiacus]